MAKKLITIYDGEVSNNLLYRYVGLVAYSLARYCGWQTAFAGLEVAEQNYENKQEDYKKYVNLIARKRETNKIKKGIATIRFLFKISHEYDIVHFMHLGARTRKNAMILKLFNPKIKIYVKCDATAEWLDEYIAKLNRNKFKKYFLLKMEKNIDLYSFETPAAVKKAMGKSIVQKEVMCIPNGYLRIKEIHDKQLYSNKENIITSVGLIGSHDKNNELLADAIYNMAPEKIEGWKVYFVGKIINNFQRYIEDLCQKKSYLKKIFCLTGNKDEKRDLYEVYAKAKVFCLTSRREGFANVFTEALSFGDYLITSNVPVADYITDGNRIGRIFPSEDVEELRNILEEVLDGKIDFEAEYDKTILFAKERFDWENIIKDLAIRLEQL